MNGMMLWMVLIGAEVLLAAFVFLLVYWIRHASASRRDRRAAAQLVARVRKGKADRGQTIAAFLSSRMGLSGAGLEQAKVAILREELRLLQQFADIYSRRDAGAAAQFQLCVEAAVGPYHMLDGATASSDSGNGVDSAELDALRRENARLSEELAVTMDTMSRMLSEYSGMFADNAGGEEAANIAPVDTEVLPHEALEREAGESDAQLLDQEETVSDPAGIDSSPESLLVPEEGIVELAPEDAVTGDLEESASGAMEEPVGVDEVDAPIAADPLEDELGSLFDSDEISVLDDPADEGEPDPPVQTVAI